MITTGVFPSPKLQSLASSYPFTQQVDVVFPSSEILEAAFSKLDTHFVTGKFGLKELLEGQPGSSSDITLCLSNSNSDDKWCFDPRRIFTLCLTKETYQRLGLAGVNLPFKGCPEQYGALSDLLHSFVRLAEKTRANGSTVVRVPLHDKSESVGMRARRKKALEDWDIRRQQDGLGKWNVIYHSLSIDKNIIPDESTFHEVKPHIRKSSPIHIPVFSLPIRPPTPNTDDIEDWSEHMSNLFEWVGMACLGAQRLEVTDRVDPYIAVYSPPSPSRTGTITHIRWKGLLSHKFVQSVIDTATTFSTGSGSDPPSFVSIAAHKFPTSPVSYIPTNTSKDSPMRVPRDEAEDTWSLILSVDHDAQVKTTQENTDTKSGSWVMIESIGSWDMRWG